MFGRIDIVCNNAGISDEDNWRKMLDINLVCIIVPPSHSSYNRSAMFILLIHTCRQLSLKGHFLEWSTCQ